MKIGKRFWTPFLIATFVGAFYFGIGQTLATSGVCKYDLSGKIPTQNENIGDLYFDGENGNVDLQVVGQAQGIAPVSAYAACGEENVSAGEDNYKLKGYVFGSNIGFLSLACENTKNLALDCGNFDYGVKIGAQDAKGIRSLDGYAWNEVLGYVKFKGTGGPGANTFDYGAKLIDNDLDGIWQFTEDSWVWTEAEIWMNLAGAKIQLPNNFEPEEIWDDGSSICKNKPLACVRVVPDVNSDKLVCGLLGVKLKKNLDGCDLDKPDYGVEPDLVDDIEILLGSDDFQQILNEGLTLDSILDIGDSVLKKALLEILLDQHPEAWDFSWGFGVDDLTAIADGKDGYQVHLYLRDKNGQNPLKMEDLGTFELNFNWKDTVKLNQLSGLNADQKLSENSTPFASGKGGVVYKPVNLNKEDFKAVEGDPGHYILKTTIRSVTPTSNANLSKMASTGYLVRNDVFFVELSDQSGKVWTGTIEPNELVLNSIDVVLKDSKGLEIKQNDGKSAGPIYPNEAQGIALKFRPAVELNTFYANAKEDIISAFRNVPMNFTFGAQKLGKPDINGDPEIKVNLDYDKINLATIKGCENVAMKFNFIDDNAANKLFHLSDFIKPGDHVDFEQQEKQAMITLKESEEGAEESTKEIDCNFIPGPAVYSVISYATALEGKTANVSYYNNMIPKGKSVASTPEVYVSGSVYGDTTFNEDKAVLGVQSGGGATLNMVRDTVFENLRKFIKFTKSYGVNRTCTISAIDKDAVTVAGCIVEKEYTVIKTSGKEKIFYTNGDIELNVNGYVGRWVFVSEGGNIYIKNNLHKDNWNSDDDHVSVIALRKKNDFKTGNAYLAPEVKNYQGAIILDGALRSYFAEKKFDAEGYPIGDIDKMISNLGNQFYCECNIYSRNTIGGADIDKTTVKGVIPKDYLLLGTGKTVDITEKNRYLAMMDDLNYLRMFKLKLELDPDTGLPIDQQCGKVLTAEDILKISKKEDVKYSGKKCDGINPTQTAPNGDLIIDVNDDKLAKVGDLVADDDKYKPVLVIFSAIPEDSLIFAKKSSLK